jgi:ABC-type glycerol-3-phosphate transport system substrate-binding protein
MQGANVASAHPRINATKTGVLKVGWIGVVKGTKNAAAAMHFINAYLDEEFQLGFAKNTGVWPSNTKARQRLRTEDALFVSLNNIDQADIDRMLRIDYKGVNINSWYDQWNRAVSRDRPAAFAPRSLREEPCLALPEAGDQTLRRHVRSARARPRYPGG